MQSRTLLIDKTAPVYQSYDVSGCGYKTANTCWVKAGTTTYHYTRHTDAHATPAYQYLTFTKDGCAPNNCAANNEVKSYVYVDSGALTDWMVNNAFLDITATACQTAGGCTGTDVTEQWSVSAGNAEGDFTVWTFLYDAAGNGIGYTNTGWSYKIDSTLPSASISINNGNARTVSSSVTLTLAYADARSGVKDCRYSNDGSVWSSWENCGTTRSWTLSAGDGTRAVYYQVRDNAENVQQTSDTIVKVSCSGYTINGVCDRDCGGHASCQGDTPGANLVHCNLGARSYFVDTCTATCQPVDMDAVCKSDLSHGSCTADRSCGGITAGQCGSSSMLCSSSCTAVSCPGGCSGGVCAGGDVVSAITVPSTSTWKRESFTATATDTPVAYLATNTCQYRVESLDGSENVVHDTGWRTRSCNGNIPSITLGATGDCRVEGSARCRVTVRASNIAGRQGTADTKTYSVDWTAPTYASYELSGCDYTSGTTCWVKSGTVTTHTIRHTDDRATPLQQYLSLAWNGCNPISCAGWEIRSYVNVDTGAFVDDPLLQNNNYLDITGTTCTESGGCTGTDVTERWSVSAGNAEGDFKVWTKMIDHAGNGDTWADTGKWLKVDAVAPSLSTVVTPERLWYNGQVTIAPTESDSRSGIASCQYQVTDGINDATDGIWRTRTCGSPVAVSVGASGLCAAQGTNACTVTLRTLDNVGNSQPVTRSFSVDYTAPASSS
ncbi:MAG: hypothetical protein HYY37_01190 [Candidatus Aenigmarchaeota archaeon]|nr:hypothetical protein [Candidatus Aenigmarchaeota archaeon]